MARPKISEEKKLVYITLRLRKSQVASLKRLSGYSAEDSRSSLIRRAIDEFLLKHVPATPHQ